MLLESNIIYGKNSMEEYYIINTDTGAKCLMFPLFRKCVLVPDSITEGDITRALKEDEFCLEKKNPTDKDLCEFIEFLKKYLVDGSRFPFGGFEKVEGSYKILKF